MTECPDRWNGMMGCEDKALTDVDVLLRTSLYMRGADFSGEFLGLFRGHLSGWSVRKSGGVGNESSAVTAPRRPQKRTVAGIRGEARTGGGLTCSGGRSWTRLLHMEWSSCRRS